MSLHSRSSLDMTGLLDSLGRSSHLFDKMEEPFRLDGGHPVPSLLSRVIEDAQYFEEHGAPLSLSSLVRCICAQDVHYNISHPLISLRSLMQQRISTASVSMIVNFW